jgi:predicted transcriptional regulator
MEKIPCEYIVWNVLPSIRKEFVKSLKKNFNLSQKQISEIIGLTPAAVSQYLSDKRGGIAITDKRILREIDKSAKIIYKNGQKKLEEETCRICNLLKSTKQISNIIGHLLSEDVSCGKIICKNNELFFENIVWNILPAIRKEFTKNLINKNKFNQKQVAEKLKITEAAVSRYVAGKRGLLEITDKNILKEIAISTNRIAKGNEKTVVNEICRICRILKTTKLIEDVN